MADGSLLTTNFLLGLLVALSLLEAVALAVALWIAVRLHARAMDAVRQVEQQLVPLLRHADEVTTVVGSVATDIKEMSARAVKGAEKAGMAFQTASDVVGLASGSRPVSRVLSLLRGARVAYQVFKGGSGPGRRERPSSRS